MAIDEDASLHELLIEPVRDLLPVAGPLYFAWVIPYGLAVLAIGVLYLRFVWSLTVRTRGLFIGAGSLYLAGALGFESVGGWYFSRHGDIEDLPYSLLVATEEFLEMSGVILFIYALLDYLRDRHWRASPCEFSSPGPDVQVSWSRARCRLPGAVSSS